MNLDCGPIGCPQPRTHPPASLYLETSPGNILNAQLGQIRNGIYIDPASKEVEREYVLDPNDPAVPVSVPPGFTQYRREPLVADPSH